MTVEDLYPDSYNDVTSDSTDTIQENRKDTIVIREKEVCRWQRSFFGDWELVCYKTNYTNSYYSYYNRPWWYHGYGYNNSNCACPYHSFYHSNCEYCWYHCDQYHHFFPMHNKNFNKNKNIGSNSGKGNNSGTSINKGSPRPTHGSIRPKKKGQVTSASGTIEEVNDEKHNVLLQKNDNVSKTTEKKQILNKIHDEKNSESKLENDKEKKLQQKTKHSNTQYNQQKSNAVSMPKQKLNDKVSKQSSQKSKQEPEKVKKKEKKKWSGKRGSTRN